jgi:hypothetical protein
MELQWKSRTISLVLDNCAANLHIDSLKNIQMEFLSPNTTSLVQPMGMGTIKNVKTLYRTKLVNYILEETEENLPTSSSTANISARIDLLQAVEFTANSWQRVSTKTIQNCFAHSSFKHIGLEMPNMANSENDILLQMHIGNY